MIFEEMLVYPLGALFATLRALLLSQRLIRIATEPLVLRSQGHSHLLDLQGFRFSACCMFQSGIPFKSLYRLHLSSVTRR